MGTGPKSRAVTDRDRVFTVGEAARYVQAAPRTVAGWFDGGRLRGYRLPPARGAAVGDRRIFRESLVAFMLAHGMPLGDLDPAPAPVLVAGCRQAAAAVEGEYVACGFELAARMAALPRPPAAVAVWAGLGRGLPAAVRAGGYAGPLVWLAGADDAGDPPAGCRKVTWEVDGPAGLRAACGLPPAADGGAA